MPPKLSQWTIVVGTRDPMPFVVANICFFIVGDFGGIAPNPSQWTSVGPHKGGTLCCWGGIHMIDCL
jgi:hypothetical protein